jgi:hypothetical protein
VSISGDAAVMGARWDDDNGSHSGSAYIFRYDGAAWVQEAKLLAAGGAAYDYFGASLSISGDNDVDLADYGLFLSCYNGPGRPPACQG